MPDEQGFNIPIDDNLPPEELEEFEVEQEAFPSEGLTEERLRGISPTGRGFIRSQAELVDAQVASAERAGEAQGLASEQELSAREEQSAFIRRQQAEEAEIQRKINDRLSEVLADTRETQSRVKRGIDPGRIFKGSRGAVVGFVNMLVGLLSVKKGGLEGLRQFQSMMDRQISRDIQAQQSQMAQDRGLLASQEREVDRLRGDSEYRAKQLQAAQYAYYANELEKSALLSRSEERRAQLDQGRLYAEQKLQETIMDIRNQEQGKVLAMLEAERRARGEALTETKTLQEIETARLRQAKLKAETEREEQKKELFERDKQKDIGNRTFENVTVDGQPFVADVKEQSINKAKDVLSEFETINSTAVRALETIDSFEFGAQSKIPASKRRADWKQAIGDMERELLRAAGAAITKEEAKRLLAPMGNIDPVTNLRGKGEAIRSLRNFVENTRRKTENRIRPFLGPGAKDAKLSGFSFFAKSADLVGSARKSREGSNAGKSTLRLGQLRSTKLRNLTIDDVIARQQKPKSRTLKDVTAKTVDDNLPALVEAANDGDAQAKRDLEQLRRKGLSQEIIDYYSDAQSALR